MTSSLMRKSALPPIFISFNSFQMFQYTIIIVLWKHRFSLGKIKKPSNVRILVVAPPRVIADESGIDVYYQVDPWLKTEESQMIEKVRELCSMFTSTQRRLIVFEAALQYPIAYIRQEMSIDGFTPEQLDNLLNSRDAIFNPRRNGLATLRQCSLSGSPQPEIWVEAVKSQIGGFPAVVKPLRPHCAHSIGIVKNEAEFKAWFRRLSNVHRCQQYVVQEYIEEGHNFAAICSSKYGLLGCFSEVDSKKVTLEHIQSQEPYALELLSAAQTRDIYPGLESFTTQVIKNAFPKGYTGIIFIKGFYKDHNDIFFLGFSLEIEHETYQSLVSQSDYNWEKLHILSLFDDPQETENEINITDKYHVVVNFPSAEGVLIHQSSIPRRKNSDMRLSWRTSEGKEMNDCDGVDDNILQVYVSNDNRPELLEDIQDILTVEVTVDRSSLAERHCRHHGARFHGKELIRSCTTAD